MIPKEKAKELFDKMYNSKDQLRKYPMCFDTSKQCALIAVDEILSAIPSEYLECWQGESQMIVNEDFEYWKEVKQEIENF